MRLAEPVRMRATAALVADMRAVLRRAAGLAGAPVLVFHDVSDAYLAGAASAAAGKCPVAGFTVDVDLSVPPGMVELRERAR